MAKKKIDETKIRALWEIGLSDEMIENKLGYSPRTVLKWRQKYDLCANRGCALTKEEAAALLPKLGDVVKKTPAFLKYENKEKPPEWPGEVIAVNEKRLTYTVKFESGLIETYKVI